MMGRTTTMASATGTSMVSPTKQTEPGAESSADEYSGDEDEEEDEDHHHRHHHDNQSRSSNRSTSSSCDDEEEDGGGRKQNKMGGGGGGTSASSDQEEDESSQFSVSESEDDLNKNKNSNHHNKHNSSPTTTKNKKKKMSDEEAAMIARRETLAVHCLRHCVILVLLGSAVGIAMAVFLYTSRSEESNFETAYRRNAQQVLDALASNILLTLKAADSFLVHVDSYATSSNMMMVQPSTSTSRGNSNSTAASMVIVSEPSHEEQQEQAPFQAYRTVNTTAWPFVTVPDFAARMAGVMDLTSAPVYYAIHPVITAAIPQQRHAWERYAALMGPVWVADSLRYQEEQQTKQQQQQLQSNSNSDTTAAASSSSSVSDLLQQYSFINSIYNVNNNKNGTEETGIEESTTRVGPYYLPLWQAAPLYPQQSQPSPYNADLVTSVQQNVASIDTVLQSQQVVLAEAYEPAGEWYQPYAPAGQDPTEPLSEIYYPILASPSSSLSSVTTPITNENTTTSSTSTDSVVVAVMVQRIYWRQVLRNMLPPDSNGILVVFENPCNPTFTYQIQADTAVYMGRGDGHSTHYDNLMLPATLPTLLLQHQQKQDTTTSTPSFLKIHSDYCTFTIKVYPSDTMKESYTTNNRVTFTVVAIVIFFFTSFIFLLYDWIVERRNRLVMKTAVRASAIVSSLFPQVVRDRLYPVVENETKASKKAAAAAKKKNKKRSNGAGGTGDGSGKNKNGKAGKGGGRKKRKDGSKARIQNFLDTGGAVHDDDEDGPLNNSYNNNNVGKLSKPIADLFPETTVLFADIAGFTAWSSMRDPPQVFTLLETLYGAFDALGKRRNVFKVETIGDSYVAVTGLPEARADHAVAMAKFARDIRDKMNELTKQLEVTLGPETADLALRIGLNSGQVTAGVLRGEKSRFQLFGDTVNTAARMESTGICNRIQVSQSTADLLLAAGKGHWVTPRDELVEAKGKGKMQTYWVEVHKHTSQNDTAASSNGAEVHSGTEIAVRNRDDKCRRLVDWNAEVLACLLREIVHKRRRKSKQGQIRKLSFMGSGKETKSRSFDTVLEEVVDVIDLPEYNPKHDDSDDDDDDDDHMEDEALDPLLQGQLHDYVTTIASMYHTNPFHGFEHASHVTMSIMKLLSRIVVPDGAVDESNDPTFGITSDPLTKFACVFSALIHDVDHPGVPNAQLVEEKAPIAVAYLNKSVTEQNSLDIAWNLFMRQEFNEFRLALCATQTDMARFRQLVVNSVMATDILDRDLRIQRNARWDRAFLTAPPQQPVKEQSVRSLDSSNKSNARLEMNRKATIVIEHLMQASDVAHTMQHWHIYRKWNERLFEEMYIAYKAGRGQDMNPALYWYKGELSFFDYVVIPLAKKLCACGIFGPTNSHEYLSYAEKNRQEWELRGNEVLESVMERIREKERRMSEGFGM